ncbi:MAG: hypothetical protein E7588_00930 [Ruminococcaceae bacterium]|nr:hypothetical protein [Oscillospiraceae bacterium]
MGEKLIIAGEIILSFLAVVGMVYICIELTEYFRYVCRKCHIPVIIQSADYSYEEILKILKAFSVVLNCRAAEFLFDKITILTCSNDEANHLTRYLGRYAGFAEIHEKEPNEQQ